MPAGPRWINPAPQKTQGITELFTKPVQKQLAFVLKEYLIESEIECVPPVPPKVNCVIRPAVLTPPVRNSTKVSQSPKSPISNGTRIYDHMYLR